LTPLLYDNVDTGHHRGYIDGLVAAAEERGLGYLVASVTRPASVRDPARWIPVQPAPLRSFVRNRAEIKKASRRATAYQADALVDLYLDKQIWSSDAVTGLTAKVHVLHHAEQLSYRGRRGSARLRTRFLRGRLERMAGAGEVICVHNDKTAGILIDLVPPDRIVRLGYPVVPASGSRSPIRTDPPTILFVGAGRYEKGLDLLFAALAADPGMARIRVVGRQPPGVRAHLVADYPQVRATWLDAFVDDATLRHEYETADLAVLPYRSRFGDHGGPSSVLLETLSAGVPIVTTDALADQLPAGYPGALIADSDSAPALIDSLRAACEDLDRLTSDAEDNGPRFISQHHTFPTYLERLLAALELART
jgi:glycosyltransferase involved in cell wall biosynthesis